MGYSELVWQNFSIIGSAIACSPVEPEPTQKIINIGISSNEAIYTREKTFEPNTDLTELFKAVDYFGRSSVPDFIIKQNKDLWSFGHYVADITLQLA